MLNPLVSRRMAAGVFAATICVSTLAASPAQAADDQADLTTRSAPMVFGGYDARVAAAHGYKIVTDANGGQTSVPVSEVATSEIALDGVAPGDCGESFLTATKLPHDTLAVNTGYRVPFAVVEKTWRVNAKSTFSQHVFPWDGPSAGAWSAQAAASMVGPGIAVVSLTSHVIGANGRVCYSAGPSDTFN